MTSTCENRGLSESACRTNVLIEFHHFLKKKIDTAEDWRLNQSFLNQRESIGFHKVIKLLPQVQFLQLMIMSYWLHRTVAERSYLSNNYCSLSILWLLTVFLVRFSTSYYVYLLKMGCIDVEQAVCELWETWRCGFLQHWSPSNIHQQCWQHENIINVVLLSLLLIFESTIQAALVDFLLFLNISRPQKLILII